MSLINANAFAGSTKRVWVCAKFYVFVPRTRAECTNLLHGSEWRKSGKKPSRPHKLWTSCFVGCRGLRSFRGGLHAWGWSFLSSKMIFDSFDSFLNLKKHLASVIFMLHFAKRLCFGTLLQQQSDRKKEETLPPNILLNQNDRSDLKFTQGGTAKQ